MIVAGTGHRPDKLGGYSTAIKGKLRDTAVTGLRKTHATQVISGGALGWDQALARAALDYKIPLTLALPFEGFWSRWPESSIRELHMQIEAADKVVYVCEPGYAPWKMQERNKWMVDHCDAVLALWNGTDGGTANCLKYATKAGKPISNLWAFYNEELDDYIGTSYDNSSR